MLGPKAAMGPKVPLPPKKKKAPRIWRTIFVWALVFIIFLTFYLVWGDTGPLAPFVCALALMFHVTLTRQLHDLAPH